MAATLALGDGAALSHRSAAGLWELGPAQPESVTVTLVGRQTRSRNGIHVHHARRLAPPDLARVHGIPVTGPGRTLLDLATCLGRRDLSRAVEQAEVLKHVHGGWLGPLFTRNPRHCGAAALRDVIRAIDAPAMTRSEAERRLLELVRAARLPAPEVNQRLHGYEVDFLWRANKLVLEVDGYAFHSSRGAFERDRRRDADLTRAGFRAIRFTWRQLTGEPEAIVAFLTRKWERELDYRLMKELWAFGGNRISVRFEYESRDAGGQWWRSHGNEHWEFDDLGYMRRRDASINDVPIDESERRYR